MYNSALPFYLASKSPRRKHLLHQMNIKFKSFSVDLDEEILDGEHPIKTVKRLAMQKMDQAVKKVKNGIVLTADTIVVLDKDIIGKPSSKKQAVEILKRLSGKTHFVYTGFVLKNTKTGKEIVAYERTAVTFRELTTAEIKKYVDGGSPMDKAGGYGIQDDFGAVFVKKISGCYYNVVGLPLSNLYSKLQEI